MKENGYPIEEIIAQRKLLSHNLEVAAIVAEKAMSLAVLNYAFSVRLLLTYVYSKKT
jgi:hypothetical protein